jgi:thiamine-monophosphate kinase
VNSEDQIIQLIKKKLGSPKSPYGIGDDAALIDPQHLITTDFLVEGVDFKRTEDLKRVGRKVINVNLSDLAAMGAVPEMALGYAAFPKGTKRSQLERFLAGLKAAANRYKVRLIGGDISEAKQWIAGAVMIGKVAKGKPFLRSGAKSGDDIWVTGTLGGSILGKHLDFEPRVREALFLREDLPVSSCIDLSDGLGQDLPRLLKCSGKGAHILPESIPVSRDAHRLSKKTRKSALEHAFQDGEDFELLFTLSPRFQKRLLQRWKRRFKTPLTRIGQVTSQKKCRLAGELWKGFDHFR